MDVQTLWSSVSLNGPGISRKHSQYQKEEKQGHSVCFFTRVHIAPCNVFRLPTKAVTTCPPQEAVAHIFLGYCIFDANRKKTTGRDSFYIEY